MKDLIFFAFDCVKDCGGADILRIIKFAFTLINIVLFIVPIGLIVMIMIDFSKNVIAGKEDEMKKNVSIVIKRIIYCMVLFLIPTIVKFAIGLVSDIGVKAFQCMDYAQNGDLSSCEVDYENFVGEEAGKKYVCYSCSDGKTNWGQDYPSADSCPGGWSIDNTKKTHLECVPNESCFYCKYSNIYKWSNGVPKDTSCLGEWEYSDRTKENCK